MRGGSVRVRGGLPLRAMPQGELLDTAVVLLRSRILPLLLFAVPLQAIEQVVLHFAGGTLLDSYAGFGTWWSVIAAQLAADAAVVTLLGTYAGAAAVPALLARKEKVLGREERARVHPFGALAVVLVLVVPEWAGAYFGLIGFLAFYGFFGLAAVATAVERVRNPFSAMGRSSSLAARLGWRAFWIRIWGCGIWFGIRVALAIGPAVFMWDYGLAPDHYLGSWQVQLMWGLAGTVSCAGLACLDAVLLIDTRIRTEGMDILVRRAIAHGADPELVLIGSNAQQAAPPAQFPVVNPVMQSPRPQDPIPLRPGAMTHQQRMQAFQADAQRRYEAQQQQGRES